MKDSDFTTCFTYPCSKFGQLSSGGSFTIRRWFLNSVEPSEEPQEPEPAEYADDFESYTDGVLSRTG